MSKEIIIKHPCPDHMVDQVNELVQGLCDITQLRFDWDGKDLIITTTKEELCFLKLQKGNDIIDYIIGDYLEL